MIVFKICSEKDFFCNYVTSFVNQFLSKRILGRSNNIAKFLRFDITAIFWTAATWRLKRISVVQCDKRDNRVLK